MTEIILWLGCTFFSVDKRSVKSDSSPQSPNENDEFPNKLRNQILSGVTAVLAMVGYALLSGLVQVWLTA